MEEHPIITTKFSKLITYSTGKTLYNIEKYGYYSKKLFSLHSNVMDDNCDTYIKLQILKVINYLFLTLE
jgi:hypothetical protein